MIIIFKQWLASLGYLKPTHLKDLLALSCKRYTKALYILATWFSGFIIADVILYTVFSHSLIKAQQAKTISKLSQSFLFVAVSFGIGITLFVLSSALLLFIRRKRYEKPIMPYFRVAFLRYIQLSFILMFTLFLGLTLIMGMGLRTFPTIPSGFIFGFKTFELIIIFYWLESRFHARDILTSIESATNLFVYNLPLFVLLIGILWGFDNLIHYISAGANNAKITLLLTNKETIEQAQAIPELTMSGLILSRYLKLFLDFLWVSIVYSVYHDKRNTKFFVSMFEQQKSEHEEDHN